MKGIWISFEGGEGSGKTTLIKRLERWAINQGMDVLVTREPGGVPIAEQIREIILSVDNTVMDPITEALLFAASRRQHLVEKVLPALAEGKLVLMDRYVDSSIAYQGYGRGLGMQAIRELNEFAIQGAWPDKTIYIDLSPEEGLARIRNNAREVNRLDQEKTLFHEKVREAYRMLAQQEERVELVDGNVPLDELEAQLIKLIKKLLDQTGWNSEKEAETKEA